MTPAALRTLRLTAVTATALLVLTGCTTVKGWFGGKSSDKAGEPAKLEAFTASATVSRLWSAQLGKGEKYLGVGEQPAVVDGTVYAAAVTGGVHAFELQTGRSLWTFSSDLPLSSGPGAGDGLVVVGSLKGDVVAIDAASGQQKWTAKVHNEVLAAPTVGLGMVFVHSTDGRVTAFAAATGEQRWFHEGDVPPLTVRGTSPVSLGPGLIFVGGDDGEVTALRASDGARLWSTPVAEPDGRSEVDRMADVDGAPVLEGRVIFATSYKGHTVAIDGPNGQILWDSRHGGARGLGLSNSAVVVTDRVGHVDGLDKNSGSSLWQQAGLLNRNVSAPAVQGDYAVVGDFEGFVHWLRLSDGAFAAREKVGGAIAGQPVVANGILLVQSSDGNLTAFALQ